MSYTKMLRPESLSESMKITSTVNKKWAVFLTPTNGLATAEVNVNTGRLPKKCRVYMEGDTLLFSPEIGGRHSSLGNIRVPMKYLEFWRPDPSVRVPVTPTISVPYERLYADGPEELWGDALRELAENRNWCHEFDEVAREVGVNDRTRDVILTLSVECDITMTQPSSQLDTDLSQLVQFDGSPEFEMSELQIECSTEVEIPLTVGIDGEPAYEVESETLERIIYDRFKEGVRVDVHDWTVIGEETVG